MERVVRRRHHDCFARRKRSCREAAPVLLRLVRSASLGLDTRRDLVAKQN
jgi:hypothetical protein